MSLIGDGNLLRERDGIRRREFLGAAAALAASTIAPGCDRAGSLPDAEKRPNVLFIVIDDLNDWVGCLGGHPDVRTPNIDALARRGVLFSRAYCPSPLCKPSRSSIFTGLRPSSLGIYSNAQSWRGALREDWAPLPEHFMANGYEVLGAGKIYQGVSARRAEILRMLPWALARPFMATRWGDWDDFIPDPSNPVPEILPASGLSGATRWFDWGPVDVPDSEMGDGLVASWVSSQLARKHDRPFFLACGFYRPHLPWYAPQRYFDLYRDIEVALPEVLSGDLDDVPAIARGWTERLRRHERFESVEGMRSAVTAYLACTSFVDACLGRVMTALDQGPNAKDTIVVLFSDHGHNLGEKSLWDKRVLWEESTHVPLIIVAPDVPAGGARCSSPVGLLDLYPTLLDLCDFPSDAALEGQSLLPLLEDPQRTREEPVVTTFGYGNHSVRGASWRYTRYLDGEEELYDHQSDPHEWVNLAGESSLAAVKRELALWLPQHNRPPFSAPDGLDAPVRASTG